MQHLNLLERGRPACMLCASETCGEKKPSGQRPRPTHFTFGTFNGLDLQFDYPQENMATRIRYSRLTRWPGSGTTDLGAARKRYTLGGARSFSSTRISAQDTEPAPTHGFSNGQNLGSITLKKNGVYLENKLRIVKRHQPKSHDCLFLINPADTFRRTRGQGAAR
jgi:hypothetical protein